MPCDLWSYLQSTTGLGCRLVGRLIPVVTALHHIARKQVYPVLFPSQHKGSTHWPAALSIGLVMPLITHPSLFRKDWLGLRKEEVWSLYYLQCVKSWNSYQKHFYINREMHTEQMKCEEKTAPERVLSILFTDLILCPEQCLVYRRLLSIYRMK